MHNNRQTIYGVGLGPGDYELVTLKGYNILKKADAIFYPCSNKDDVTNSVSYNILNQLDLNAELYPMYIPMKSRNDDSCYYDVYQAVKKQTMKSKIVAIVSEGDLLFYSTFGYLLPFFKSDNFKIEIIPGIPAFISAGALSENVLVEKNQELKVLAVPSSFDQVLNTLVECSTLVVMKLSVISGWYNFLKNNKCKFFYVERIGMANCFFTSRVSELKDRVVPYFAILIIYNN